MLVSESGISRGVRRGDPLTLWRRELAEVPEPGTAGALDYGVIRCHCDDAIAVERGHQADGVMPRRRRQSPLLPAR